MSRSNSQNFKIHKRRKSKFRYTKLRHDNLSYKRIILAVIAFAMLTVIISAVSIAFLDTEKQVKDRISNLAEDYYENYLYSHFTNSDKFKNLENPEKSLEKYHNYGFSPISLNDLLLYDNQKNAKHTNFLTKYCDPNKTKIKFFIDPPYNQSSYHIEYTYSCNF